MEKKAKAAIAAAAGALAIGLALSAGSCALRQGAADAPQESGSSQVVVEQAAEGVADDGGEEAGQTAFERACAKDWRADGATLQLSKGMLVERDAKGALHVLTISDAAEDDAGDQAIITLAGTDEDSQKEAEWTLILDEAGGAATLSCDGFKAAERYEEHVSAGTCSVGGLDEAYLGLVGGDAGPLRSALADYLSKNVPQAASATFDGEAVVDFAARSVTATFHADDPAKTVLTVTYADGSFEVAK